MRLYLVTTFPNSAWELYAREALESLAKNLPPEVKMGVGLDDEALNTSVNAIIKTRGQVLAGWQADHREFVIRNKDRDHPTNYRLKATVFSHKIFVLRHFFEQALSEGYDYVIWWDADAILTRPVSTQDLQNVLPSNGEAVSYLGRKDWDHSECGFMGFNVKHPGAKAILDFMHYYYMSGSVFSLPQWHDSYLFDVARAGQPARNLSAGVPGNNVWAATPLGGFSEHRKGPEAKQLGRAMSDKEFYASTKNS
jgi:hypothetical protein